MNLLKLIPRLQLEFRLDFTTFVQIATIRDFVAFIVFIKFKLNAAEVRIILAFTSIEVKLDRFVSFTH